jgi:hypothetical protein
MIKNFTLGLLLFFSICGTAQSVFYPGTLTRNDNSNESVFFKNREYVLTKNGELNIYSQDNDESKISLSANDFTRLISSNEQLVLETTSLPNFKKGKKIVLRKLVDGKNSLYSFYDDDNIYFVNKKDNQFVLLNSNKTKNENDISLREWLFHNFNPQNKKASEFQNIKYNSTSLKEYFLTYNANGRELEQEPSSNIFEYIVDAGINLNNIKYGGSQSFSDYSDISATNFRIGARTSININSVANNINLLTGVHYYTSIDKDSETILFPESLVQRRKATTTVNLSHLNISFGVKYNIHFESFSISPFAMFDPIVIVTDYSLKTVRDDGQVYYDISALRNSPNAIRLGLQFKLSKFFATMEYSSISDLDTVVLINGQQQVVIGNSNSLTFGFGYQLF